MKKVRFRKIVVVAEKLHDIEIDDIGNLEDFLRLVFIDVECGDLKVFVDGIELTRNINQKLKSEVLQTTQSHMSTL